MSGESKNQKSNNSFDFLAFDSCFLSFVIVDGINCLCVHLSLGDIKSPGIVWTGTPTALWFNLPNGENQRIHTTGTQCDLDFILAAPKKNIRLVIGCRRKGGKREFFIFNSTHRQFLYDLMLCANILVDLSLLCVVRERLCPWRTCVESTELRMQFLLSAYLFLLFFLIFLLK